MSDNKLSVPDGLAWIWCDDDVETGGRMAYFRLKFDSVAGGGVRWTGFADTFYSIALNGAQLGIGPVSGIRTMPRLSVWDLSAHLRGGENVLSLAVWFDRARQASDTDVYKAGLIGWLDNGDETVLTGSAWRCTSGPNYELASPDESGFGAKRVVIGDLREAPRGWMAPGFDDSTWRTPAVNAVHPDAVRSTLRMSPLPPLTQTSLRPATLIDAGIARGDMPLAGAQDVARRMIGQSHESLIRVVHQFDVLAVDRIGQANGLPSPPLIAALGWDAIAASPMPMPVRAVDGEFYVVWDMGLQTSGNVWLDLDAPAQMVIDFAYADHLQLGRVNPRLQNHSYADRLLVAPGRQQVCVPHERGFRYLQVSFSASCVLHDLHVDEHVYPHDDVVRFECSDAALNGVWEIAAATLHQCTLHSHCDNTRRERQGWSGPDLYAQAHGYFAVFGDMRITGKMFADYCDFFESNGFIPNWYPAAAPAVKWISAHDIWFPISAWDYILYTNDRALAPRLLAAAEAVLDYYASHRDGVLLAKAHPDACRWVEWNMNAAQEISTWENLLAVVAWRALAKLREYVGAHGKTDALAEADAVAAAVSGRLWHEGAGALAQGTRHDGTLVDHCAQIDNAFALLHRILPDDRRDRAYRFCAGRSGTWPTSRSDWQGVGQGERARYDPRKPVVTGTPFGSSVCAQTIFEYGAPPASVAEALHYIRYNFGAMLDEGEGTLWEMWQVHQNEDVSSTCFSQGYGAHIASTLIRCILGVTVEAPGGSILRWNPNPCGLEFVRGRVETIHGPVTFEADSRGARFTAPEGVTVTYPVPDDPPRPR